MTDTRERIIDRVEQSLKNFKVDTIDLYLLHFPGDDPANIQLTWGTLIEMMLQGKSWAQVQLRCNYQMGICSIPKAHNKDHQAENLNNFDFAIDEKDMMCIRSIR